MNNPYNLDIFDEVQEFIPVMTPFELGMITNGLIRLTPEHLAYWQKLLNSWINRRNEMIRKIEKAYAKQR